MPQKEDEEEEKEQQALEGDSFMSLSLGFS